MQVGDLATVRLVLDHNVDVNVQGGWGLRRAVRYNHPHVWQLLLDNTNTQVVRLFHGISKWILDYLLVELNGKFPTFR